MCKFLKKGNKGDENIPLCFFTNKKCPYATYCQYLKDFKLQYNWKNCSLYSNYWKGKIVVPES